MNSQKELTTVLAEKLINRFTLNGELEQVVDGSDRLMASFELGQLLWEQLKLDPDWDRSKWIDDTLIHKLRIIGDNVHIWGVVIWGKGGTTEQWTDPIYTEIQLDVRAKHISDMQILFADADYAEISFSRFTNKRTYWDAEFYSTDDWDPKERDWFYNFKVV